MNDKRTKWEVASIPIACGEKIIYQVYRKIDPTKIDHTGNREWGKAFLSEAEAVVEAERLNKM